MPGEGQMWEEKLNPGYHISTFAEEQAETEDKGSYALPPIPICRGSGGGSATLVLQSPDDPVSS